MSNAVVRLRRDDHAAATRSPCSARRPATSPRSCSCCRSCRARASAPAAWRSPASTSTSCSDAGRTTRGAPPRPARTSPTPTRCRCASPAAAPPTLNSNGYLYHGSCLPMEVLRQDNAWTPDTRRPDAGRLVPADHVPDQVRPGQPGAASSAAQPTAFTSLRSTYRHEADSAIGFQMFNDPAAMGDAAGFTDLRRQHRVRVQLVLRQLHPGGVLQLRHQPGAVRPVSDPNLPMRGDAAHEWVGWNPDTNVATYTPVVRASAVGQPGLLRQLEQQAGQGLRRGRRQLQLRRGPPWTPARRRRSGRPRPAA